MRFISEDTNKGDVKDPLSLNLYAYCQGNPIRYYDYSGNDRDVDPMGLMGNNLPSMPMSSGALDAMFDMLDQELAKALNMFDLFKYVSINDAKYMISTSGRMNMAEKTHPVTGVQFDSKGFPMFESFYNFKLDPSDYLKSRGIHSDKASKAIYNEILKNPELASKFTQREIEIFKEGGVPKRFTWHHNQEPGLLQLVYRTLHKKTGHDGGFCIWSLGYE